MPKALLGKKLGMTQVFTSEGKVVPVTVVEVGPCVITQIKTKANEGYEAIQMGCGSIKPVNTNKPQSGLFKKVGTSPRRYLRELRVEDAAVYNVGDELKADIFAEGEKIDVTGCSKGKGFAGTIKRWNHSRGPMGHGSKCHRRPASAGAKGPARVFKGKLSPGRLGGERVTVQNLEIIRVDAERNLLLIKGALPGPKEGFLTVKNAGKIQ